MDTIIFSGQASALFAGSSISNANVKTFRIIITSNSPFARKGISKKRKLIDGVCVLIVADVFEQGL